MGFYCKMLLAPCTVRRVSIVGRVLSRPKIFGPNLSSFIRFNSDNKVVTIGDVSKQIKPAKNPEYIPRKYLSKKLDQETLRHLKWMLQKDILGQDIFLMGGPGSIRRNLALAFLELTEQETEFVALSRDTTEADLKQRREIRDRTAYYYDQSVVRAAINGRALILEGVEKAERNVLPILNNLLENREMHLEDGRFLVPASRYDKLLKVHSQEELDAWRLVRVSEDFRVIALGLPSPRYPGYPLDPPFRSRFQARHVPPLCFEEQLDDLKRIASKVDEGKLSALLSCCHSLVTEEAISLGIPDFPLDNLPLAAVILDKVADAKVYDVFYRFYPYKLFLPEGNRNAVENVLETFKVLKKYNAYSNVKCEVRNVEKEGNLAEIIIHRNKGHNAVSVNVPRGSGERTSADKSEFIETDYQNYLLTDMMQSHLASDFCLIGPKGCGKSITVQKLADMLGYQVEPIVLYQDMTSRDLIQQRTTLMNGDTIWRNSSLVTAALEGKLAVLDGIHRVHPSTLAVVYRLVHDRELQLHDGKRLLRADRYDEIKAEQKKSDAEMLRSGILRIHPSFRIIALAEPPSMKSSSGKWLNAESLSLFLFHEMRTLDKAEEIHIIRSKHGEPSVPLLNIIDLAHTLRSSKDPVMQSLAESLSTRQLLRIAARMHMFPNDNAYDAVHKACLARFLPMIPYQALQASLIKHDIRPAKSQAVPSVNCEVIGDSVMIGSTVVKRHETTALTKVPDVLFYNMPQHVALLEALLQDFVLGQNILLVGNQGVGKNKIVDRLLQLLNRPREYIQLHRDTTVQTLTLQPTVRDGVVVYEDSPLVQAVKSGHVLVVDEADKAPIHVTCILKTLVESGEMILSDGRRIVPFARADKENLNLIPIHPDFKMIVLANRPGFPFLGNDFFSALGDLFSTHSVDNPSLQDEILLLKQYGPNVDETVIFTLVKAFGELRSMADKGLVAYPYSTREVVNIVKHLQKFPKEPLANVVRNVFDFDRYTQEVLDTLMTVLRNHGIPIGTSLSDVTLAKEVPLPEPKLCGSWIIQNQSQTIPVQERYIKLNKPSYPEQSTHPLNRIEARSTRFTELRYHWTLPLNRDGTVAGLSVASRPKGDSTNDRICVLVENPLSIFSMTPESSEILEISLESHLTSIRKNVPLYTIVFDNSENLLVHEETTNSLISVNLEEGAVRTVQLSSSMSLTNNALFRTFSNERVKWKLNTDLLAANNQLVLFTFKSNKIDVVDMGTMNAYTMCMPFGIQSIIVSSSGKWLLQDSTGNQYTLHKYSDSSPCPNILKKVEKSGDEISKLGSPLSCSKEGLSSVALNMALQQKIECPNRIFTTNKTYASMVMGFPDLDSSNDVYIWPRNKKLNDFAMPLILDHGRIIRIVSFEQVLTNEPTTNITEKQPETFMYLEIVDVVHRKVRYIPIPNATNVPLTTQWYYPRGLPFYAAMTSDEGLVTVDGGGCVRSWEILSDNIERSLHAWQDMVRSNDGNLQITKERYSGLDASGPKHGKVDKDNSPHVGGNTWAGGTGGRDTAGLGGKGGPYRLDSGHTVHQLSDEEKNAVPKHIKEAAREMGLRAFHQRLKEIRMSEYDHNLYTQLSDNVHKQVQALRVILGSLQSKSTERQWCRHQTSGELDDTKLIEGLTGEKTIYRRRVEKDAEFGSPRLKPKLLRLVVDVSGSMYRFNSYDERMNREMEACIMIMEAFSGYEEKFKYEIVGHSGEDYHIPFVKRTKPPTDNKKRLEVVKTMHAHSQYCLSGDYTLEATRNAISTLPKEDFDESIVVVFSDANLERYDISPEQFADVLTSRSSVNAYAIFIGSLGNQAIRLANNLPSGRAFVCMDLKNIPRILQQIFTASILSTTRSN